MSRIMRLSDLGRIVTGNTPKTSDFRNYNSKDICFVKPSDIPVDCIGRLRESEFYISEFARDKARMLPKGSVLLTCIGIIGKVAVNEIECAFNQQINAIIPDCDKCDCIYLAYALSAKKDYLQALANAPVVPIINKTQFSAFQVPVPSLSVQSDIVKRIEIIDYLISLRQRQTEKLDELVKARFVEMFGDPVRNTKQFPLVELQDLYDVSSSKRVYQDEMVLDGIPFLRISDIVEKSTNDKCTPQCFISQEMYDQLSQKGLTPNVGDILVTSRGTLGLCYEVKPGEKFYFQDGMISWLYNRKDCVINTYLLYAFRMPGIRKQIDGSNDGSTVSYLSIARLKRLKIELPPLALQTEFSHFVHEVDREKERIQRSAALLETLKRSLMQQYFG